LPLDLPPEEAAAQAALVRIHAEQYAQIRGLESQCSTHSADSGLTPLWVQRLARAYSLYRDLPENWSIHLDALGLETLLDGSHCLPHSV
jgi:hypothetical protein